MDTQASIRAFLDSLSQLPGSLLYRDRLGWKALAPGSTGQKLSLSADLLPQWVTFEGQKYPCIRFTGVSGTATHVMPTLAQQFTRVFTFSTTARAGTGYRTIDSFENYSSGQERMRISINDNSFAQFPGKLHVQCWNSSGVRIYNAQVPHTVTDGNLRTLFFAFNAATGASKLVVDRITITPATSTTGSMVTGSVTHEVGRYSFQGSSWWNGLYGHSGYKEQYRTNDSDFFDSANEPLLINTSSWPQWGGQPYTWTPYGDHRRNMGSRPAYTVGGVQYTDLPP